MIDSSSTYPLPDSARYNRILWGTMLVVSLLAAVAAARYSWLWAAAPIMLAIIVVSFVWPRVGILFLVVSLFIRISLPSMRGVYPADLLTFLIIFGVLAARIANGERLIERSWINPILFAILAGFALSLVEAHEFGDGVVNLLRHVQLFALLVFVMSGAQKGDARRIMWFFLLSALVISLVNMVSFVASGGSARIFGLPGPFFALYAVLACMHAAIEFVTTERLRHRLGWGLLFVIFFGGLIATQTRAALMQAGFGLMFLMTVVWLWSRARGEYRLNRRVFILIVSVLVMGTILMTGVVPFLENPANRIIRALEGHEVTVAYRLFLWKTGVLAFLDSPVLGLGLGQISTWEEVFSQWRFDPIGIHTRGLGAHNDFITYLAETGLVGTLALFWLFWRVMTTGTHRVRRMDTINRFAATLHLWIPCMTIIIGYFFSTHMFYSLAGMVTAIYFGLWARLSRDDLPTIPS